ncbi:cytochrome P450 [Archangium gephyra]|uniref:cytochrome P450 n=1 Tax=Archangium gephyra TaxID=48 RepID=UPI0035D42618
MTGSGTSETTPAEKDTASAGRDRNPVSPENLLNPYPFYKELRDNDPVHWSDTLHAWILTRYDDVMNFFRDSRMSADRVAVFEHQVKALGPDILKEFIEIVRRQMVMKDGRDHIRMRRQANPNFTPQALDNWRPAIRNTMRTLVDRVHHQGQMNLATEISYEFPPRVIAELFGLPPEEHDQLLAWAAPIAQLGSLAMGGDPVDVARRANKAIVEFAQFLTGMAEKHLQAPGHDLISRMLEGQRQDPKGGTMEELVANAILMLIAGHTTTTDQLSNLVEDLLTHPEQLQMVRNNPSLLPAAVEESLRYHPAVPFHYRIAADDIPIRGRNIRKGDMVFFGIAAANRDPQNFTDPDRFDITRDSMMQKHVAFSFGPHHCLGAGLARRELEIGLEVLLQRMPGLRLDEERPPQIKAESLVFRGFHSLHVRW